MVLLMVLLRVVLCFVGLYVARALSLFGQQSLLLQQRGRRSVGLQLRSTKDDKNDGEFKISPKPPVTVDGLGEAPFRQSRTPAPISDSAVVLVGTCACLAACVAVFLFINRDISPPPY